MMIQVCLARLAVFCREIASHARRWHSRLEERPSVLVEVSEFPKASWPWKEETDQAVRRMAYVSSVVPILLLVLEETWRQLRTRLHATARPATMIKRRAVALVPAAMGVKIWMLLNATDVADGT